MRALPGLDAPAMERLLPRGPDAARPARSAVERLAADRAKYVRARPGTASDPAPEGRSPGPGEGQTGDPRPPARAPGAVARRAIARKPLRPDSLVIYRQKCEFVRGPDGDSFRGGLVRKLFPGPGKDKTPSPPETSLAGEEGRAGGAEGTPTKPGPAAPLARPSFPAAPPTPPVRPSVQAAPLTASLRPRVPGAPRTPTVRPSVQAAPSTASLRPRVPGAPRTPTVRPSVQVAPPTPPVSPSVPAAPGNREPPAVRRRGLQRSQSDLSSRRSMSAAEFDTFFQFCGLEPEVVEALGRENFSAGSEQGALKVRSVSVATSDSGFSRHSGGDEEGLQEEELTEQVPSTTSVVERNARIIKWLYTCQKAGRELRPEAGTRK